jgi:3',5'-cyclic AMP phosphodiesterase CpdA
VTTPSQRVVVHLSDLHFGREDDRVVAALIGHVRALSPDLIAISGDLTQRARRRQFARARAFLDALPRPQLIVPGNHDVPLYNLPARLLDPLGGYRRFIAGDVHPIFVDPLLVVVGTDTTKPSTLKAGRIPDRELARVCSVLRESSPDAIKIFVGHHPFEAPDEGRRDAVDSVVLDALTAAGADVFLTGHLHVSYTGHTAHRFKVGGRSAIVVEAGTATSTRLRDATNAFNLLRITFDAITVERHDWQGTAFAAADSQRFARTATGWTG